MTVITIKSTASLDSRSAAQAGFVAGLFAGEAIDALAACRIHTDGKVYEASTSYKTSGSVCHYAGFAGKAVAANAPITLFRASAIASYADSMTPGTYLYISGSATKGQLADAPVLGTTDEPVAMAISANDIVIIK